MHYIFSTKTAATQYDTDVTALHNYPAGDNWANPRKHPSKNKWAILCNPALEIEGKEAVELTEDWTPAIDVE